MHDVRYTRYKSIQAKIRKSPIQVALHLLLVSVAVGILAVTKWISPETYMLDPAHNSIFFVCFFLAFDSEWWAYSILVRSIISSITKTLRDQSDRDVMLLAKKIDKITYRVPYIDLVTRVLTIIVPGPVGGFTNNSYNLLVISVVNFYIYNLLKFWVYPFVWTRAIYLAVKIATRKKIQSTNTGSFRNNDEKLTGFKRKMNFFVASIIIGNGYNLQ